MAADVQVHSVDLFHHASLFLWRASADDIEYERQALEATYRVKLAPWSIEAVTRSGAPCTRVTWEVV